jgi:hypothetical protein
MPPVSPMHCGTLYCKYSTCPHNPFFAHGTAGIYAAARANGQLVGMARNGAGGLVLRGEDQRMIGGV